MRNANENTLNRKTEKTRTFFLFPTNPFYLFFHVQFHVLRGPMLSKSVKAYLYWNMLIRINSYLQWPICVTYLPKPLIQTYYLLY